MRMNQVTVPITDLDRAVRFYTRLGLIQIVSAPPRYARFRMPVGDATFSVEHVGTLGGDEAPVVYFECDDLDAKVRALVADGVVFEHLPVDQPWLWREARLRDPDGNRLCLFHAGENRLNPPWRIPGS
jgi:catechol 2,3-dioxygenase-like lactoylglutathione lyase family enzyme